MGNREQGIENLDGLPRMAPPSSDIGDTGRTGEATQSGDTRLVELLRAFYRTAMHKLFRYIDQRLEQWARRKYKTLLRRKRRRVDWLRRMKNASPTLFYAGVSLGKRLGHGSRVNREIYARFCERLKVKSPGPTHQRRKPDSSFRGASNLRLLTAFRFAMLSFTRSLHI